MCSCHSILECCVMFSGAKLSMGSFLLLISNKMKYEAEIWYLEVIYDDDFDYDIKIVINWQN